MKRSHATTFPIQLHPRPDRIGGRYLHPVYLGLEILELGLQDPHLPLGLSPEFPLLLMRLPLLPECFQDLLPYGLEEGGS